MKTIYVKVIVAVLSFLVLGFQGCKQSDSDGFDFYSPGSALKSGDPCLPLVSKSEPLVVDIQGDERQFSYNLELGDSSKDVCFIFTNPTFYSAENSVVVNSQRINLGKSDFAGSSLLREKTGFDEETLTEHARKHGLGLRGIPEISEFNANPPKLTTSGGVRLRASKNVREPRAIGNTEEFYDYNGIKSIKATLRSIAGDSSVTVNIWVSDDSFGEHCGKAYCLSNDMLDQFGEKFLTSGSENDIYDWIVNIFGFPWGDHNLPGMISSAAKSQIDILFYDIDADNSINGGVLGFFWSKDNYTKSKYPSSHERLIFYMDSVMSATPCLPVYGECSPGDINWEIGDYWPSEIISTLAHEFQHMINFYQKQVKGLGSLGNTRDWINEMSSLVAEDLLADKLLVSGPRGVAYDEGGTGYSDNRNGRLPRYNYYNYEALSNWYSGMKALVNYSLSYSFGAYLARNYGGASLFRKIVQNQYGDYRDVESSLESSGYYTGSSDVFADVLKDWGIAVLLSNRADAPEGRRYNTGDYFVSVLGNVSYNLGSINFYNYCFGDDLVCGPRGLSVNDLEVLNSHFKTSNTYVKWGSGLTGPLSLTITLPDNIKMTAVIADSE